MAQLSSCIRLTINFVTLWTIYGLSRWAPQHSPYNARTLSRTESLGYLQFRSPLLSESLLFSFRPATKMFQFAGFPPQWLFYSSKGFRVQTLKGFPIRNSRDQRVLAPTPGLSQLYTSFIGCQYQGIHRKLFVALPEQYITENSHTAILDYIGYLLRILQNYF